MGYGSSSGRIHGGREIMKVVFLYKKITGIKGISIFERFSSTSVVQVKI